jgi:lipoprotein-anchoring transpeptidase ErfK/SrfK
LIRSALIVLPLALVLVACDEPNDDPSNNAPSIAGTPQVAEAPIAPAFTRKDIDTAAFTPIAVTSPDRTPSILRAQILLDRAKFSPGVIDGRYGENVRQALAAFEEANGLPVDGQIDQAVFDKLTMLDSRPVLTEYTITAADVAGPFIPAVPTEIEDQSKLPGLEYTGPAELLAEKFHMTEDLLKTLNPGAELTMAGQTILVADQGDDVLTGIASIEVDKAESAVKAYDAAGKLLAFYPATIGSEELATPDGVLKVTGVSRHPTYTFDPTRLTWKGPKKKTIVKAGPNNPVGAVWIALNKPTYGIHGAPDPALIGKRASHGCVRLTNWDALELAEGIKPGVEVRFTGGAAASAGAKT